MSERPIVEVEWVDSRGGHGNWAHMEDILDNGPCVLQSVGYLMRDEPDHIVIVPHYGDDPEQGCGEMTIPKQAVRSMRHLDTGIAWSRVCPSRQTASGRSLRR